MRKVFLFLISLFLFSSCKEKNTVPYDILISNLKIIDIESGSFTEGKIVLIENDTIKRIVDESEIRNFTARETLDAGGAFLMPGLWDMHVHFRGGDSLIAENKSFCLFFWPTE